MITVFGINSFNQQKGCFDCQVCGINNPCGFKAQFYEFEDDTGFFTGTITQVPHTHCSYPSVAHGGAICTLLDEVGGRTAMIGAPDRFMRTRKLIEVEFINPLPTETPIIVTGRMIKDRKKIIIAESAIHLPDNERTLIATCKGMYVAMKPSEFSAMDVIRFGWKVYPQDG